MILPQESEEVIRLLPESHVLTVRIKRENTENYQKNGIWSDYVISSSYAIIYILRIFTEYLEIFFS